jgi:prepilin-type N-terminal cleavage/methylation domain-containing protein
MNRVGRRRQPHRARGFTLIEILATLLLLGIVMPVAMRGISIALASADHARHVSEAAALAETKLNDLLTQGVSSASGLTGDFSPDHPEYTWSYQSAPRDFGTSEVQLRVTWQERGQARNFDLCTMSYDNTATTGGLP